MTVIERITKWTGVTLRQHAEYYLPEGKHSDSGCNWEATAVMKQTQFSFGQMDIDENISNTVGYRLLHG